MGMLVKGKWVDKWYDTESTGGEFKRQDSRFRDWVTADGDSGFVAESGRYHLYVAMACPWAHRALIFRRLKGLEAHIGVSVVEPLMLENGWEFGDGGDPLYGKDFLYQLYLLADPGYEGRVTVPVLWDKERKTIVNNESAEIIRMLNSAFDGITGDDQDFYPEDLWARIDEINARVYDCINNGVYRAGFATRQQAYAKAYHQLFEALDWVEGLLGEHRYLAGDRITEADLRLFTTLVRFDAVYYSHFKCNRQRIDDYPRLSNYLRELYQWPGVADTVDFHQIKNHYYGSHKTINPTGIVPLGPELDLEWPHNRG